MSGVRSPRHFPLLLALFVGSGCAALIYEVVWLQLLQLVIGSSAASLAVLLGTFMGGMCLGSILLPRYIGPRVHPLRVYALLELGTALFGILILLGLPTIQYAYTASVGHGFGGILLRSVACAVCLLAPTMMMGATLPAISRWIETSPEAASWWGFFYGCNIAGGVVGCGLAGFYLLRLHDMAVATYVAAAINVAVGLTGLALARSLPWRTADDTPENPVPRPEGSWSVYFAIGLSGLCALGAEVIWTRLLSLMLGPTVYTFSIILAVFLAGLGIGSAGGSYLAKQAEKARLWLGLCQILQVAGIAWAAYLLAEILPFMAGNVDQTYSPWRGFQGDIGRSALAILPAAVLWGASFPLALASVSRSGRDPGRLVGEVYGANTVGAIVGSLCFSLIFIPQIGTQHSQQVLMLLSALAAVIALGPVLNQVRSGKARLAFGVVAAVLIAMAIPPIPWKLIGFGRRLPTTTGTWNLLYMTEGMNSSVAYSQYEGVTTYFHVSGKVEASAEPQDMRLQRLLGHLPALLHPHPKSVLVVGCGAGVTAGTFVVHPEIEHITICEIEPRIPPATARYFGKENHNVIRDPRTRVVYDDARHFVLTTPEKFDIITSDPIHPYVKGIAPLYSTEYFELVKKHLNPGGFVTQWVPLYESNLETVQSEIATFFEAFPNGSIWGNLNTDGQGYDVVLVGQMDPLHIDLDGLDRRLARPDQQEVVRSMREVGYNSAADLLATYAVSASDLRVWLRNAQINRDRNLRLQYLAGMGLNNYLAPTIYSEILSHGKFPNDLFAGSPERVTSLQAAMEQLRLGGGGIQ
jgi:spermidine synthase